MTEPMSLEELILICPHCGEAHFTNFASIVLSKNMNRILTPQGAIDLTPLQMEILRYITKRGGIAKRGDLLITVFRNRAGSFHAMKQHLNKRLAILNLKFQKLKGYSQVLGGSTYGVVSMAKLTPQQASVALGVGIHEGKVYIRVSSEGNTEYVFIPNLKSVRGLIEALQQVEGQARTAHIESIGKE